MDRWFTVVVLSATLAIAGCSEALTRPKGNLTLTAAQAATLVSRAQLIASTNADLAWAADSMDVVLKAGAEARFIELEVNGVVRTYYAVGLTQQVNGANAFSTFHFFAFDGTDSPTDFFLAKGYAAGSSGAAPTFAAGVFGDSTVFAHIIHASGTSVIDLVAREGAAAFVVGEQVAPCDGGPAVPCYSAQLTADFRIDVAQLAVNPNRTHSVSQTHVVVPGVLLVFNQPRPPSP